MSNLPWEPTRRDDSGFEGHPQAVGPDAGLLATTREGAWLTRREGQAGGGGDGGDGLDEATVALPVRLRERFVILRQFPDPGAEADVVLARAHDGAEVVIKLYRLGVHADRDVWQRLGALSSSHIVRILETGQAAGRDYECMEYLPGGNLLSLVADGHALTPGVVRVVIEQVTDALDALHGAGIVHCDLKPENILIRCGGPAYPGQPLDLVLTDFGLSRAPEQSVVAASRSGTMAYLAPELMLRSGAQSSKARDWWALGVVVRELLTAERPFSEMTERGVEWSVLMSGLDLTSIQDTRLRLLCQGLLTRNPVNRWGSQQLRSWLAGHEPAVVEDEAPPAAAPEGIKPLSFAGTRHYNRASLAQAFVRSWDNATRRFLVGLARGDNPSQAWRTLRVWLEQFDDLDVADADSLTTLIDDWLLAAEPPPDVKMLHLLRWLDPTQPPIYRGQSMDRDTLAETARRAANNNHQQHTDAARIVRDLWTHQLLPVLAHAPGGEHLTGTHEQWTASATGARTRVAHLLRRVPEPRPQLDQEWARAVMLLLATDKRTADITTRWREAAVHAIPGHVDWFQELQHEANTNPIDDLAVITAAPAALTQAQATIAETERLQAERQGRLNAWESSETQRESGKDQARTRAIKYIAWLAVLYIAALFSHMVVCAFNPQLWLWQLVLGSGAVCAVSLYAMARSELSFAREAGDRYHRSDLIDGIRRARRPKRPAFSMRPTDLGTGLLIGCLIYVSLIVVLVFVLIPPALYGVVTVFHFVFLQRHRKAWREAYNAERTRVLGEAQ